VRAEVKIKRGRGEGRVERHVINSHDTTVELVEKAMF
jgi:hypothetical protein